jgi:hypothetical protein
MHSHLLTCNLRIGFLESTKKTRGGGIFSTRPSLFKCVKNVDLLEHAGVPMAFKWPNWLYLQREKIESIF